MPRLDQDRIVELVLPSFGDGPDKAVVSIDRMPAPGILIYLLPADAPDEFWVMLATRDSGDGSSIRIGRISERHDGTWAVFFGSQVKMGKAKSKSDAMRACATRVLSRTVTLEPLD